ncbi:MAG: PD-(D/E)XK nuclease family protein, partial [Lachnospiraceae bacterium]|nr:PD-(D/E)XK nuclease family protein [Lachnospiraceae bacterium]
GVINHMKAAISEMIQYGIDPDRLSETGRALSGDLPLSEKLMDLSIIYREYMALKDADTMSAEEIQVRAADVLEHSDFLRGSMIAIDGFTGFTPVQMRIITCLMQRCLDCTVAITLPEGEKDTINDPFDLFSLTKKTIKSLRETAEFNQIYPRISSVSSINSLQKPADLAFAADHFLRDHKVDPYGGKMEHVSITACTSPLDEAIFAADTIARLVREKGYRYRDFAVVSADLEGNKTYLARAFADAGIPAYIDVKKGITEQPISVFLLSAAEIVEKQYSFDSVFRFLRAGFSDITPEETDLLQNYCFSTGIKGRSKWAKPFTRASRNYKNIDYEQLNDIRERAISPVLRFHDQITAKGHTYADACQALRALLDELKVEQQLAALGAAYEEKGDVLEGRLYAQIYPCVEKLIGQIESILGSQRYNMKELKEMLQAGLSQLGIGSVPPVLDEVQTGDLRRSRRGQIKVLFFINCTESNLPKKEFTAGILTDDQREKLTKLDMELAPSARENSINERFYLYELFNQPEDMLYVTYSKRDRKGDAVSPSTYIPMITGLYESHPVGSFDSESAALPENRKEARRLLSACLREFLGSKEPDRARQLYASFKSDPSEAAFLKLVTEAGFFIRRKKSLQEPSVKRLYPGNIDTSITRLEKQAGCAYSSFLRYDMGLKDPEPFELDVRDIGNISHALIENVIQRLVKMGIDPDAADDAMCRNLAEDAYGEICAPYADHMADSDRDRYYISRLRRMTEKNIRVTLDQLAGSTFRPVFTEADFDGRDQEELVFPVNESQNIIISGRIDRIDISRGEDGQIARVIDYKTGTAKLDMNKVVKGLSLQLMVYLQAVKGLFRDGTTPGGAYYFKIKNPMIEVKPGEDDPETIRAEVMDAMKLDGLQIDSDAVSAADPNTKSVKASPKQLEIIQDLVRQEIIRLGRSLTQGDIDVVPYRQGSSTPCGFCDYAGVCGFDDRLAGYRYRRIPKKRNADVVKEITNSGSKREDN